ncbi:MAG: adenine phosphoribosyltransferase [Campylobacter sp.]|nr:adenine phosphoribosyltransferase [Campylobacter sp.]
MKELNENDKKYLLSTIREIKDYPKAGILFRDITTLLNDKNAFEFLMSHLEAKYKDAEFDYIAGIESRGFIFGAALATRLNLGFVPIRKPKKLPYTTISQKYSLEYGFDQIEIHIDAFRDTKDAKVLLVDDLIATGGTAFAAAELIQRAGAICAQACFVMDLPALGGSEKLGKITKVYSVLEG